MKDKEILEAIRLLFESLLMTVTVTDTGKNAETPSADLWPPPPPEPLLPLSDEAIVNIIMRCPGGLPVSSAVKIGWGPAILRMEKDGKINKRWQNGQWVLCKLYTFGPST